MQVLPLHVMYGTYRAGRTPLAVSPKLFFCEIQIADRSPTTSPHLVHLVHLTGTIFPQSPTNTPYSPWLSHSTLHIIHTTKTCQVPSKSNAALRLPNLQAVPVPLRPPSTSTIPYDPASHHPPHPSQHLRPHHLPPNPTPLPSPPLPPATQLAILPPAPPLPLLPRRPPTRPNLPPHAPPPTAPTADPHPQHRPSLPGPHLLRRLAHAVPTHLPRRPDHRARLQDQFPGEPALRRQFGRRAPAVCGAAVPFAQGEWWPVSQDRTGDCDAVCDSAARVPEDVCEDV